MIPSFESQFSPAELEHKAQQSRTFTDNEVKRVLSKSTFTVKDLPALLSPAAQPYIEVLAQKARALTLQRFGHTMQLFAPMYISNVCYNSCTYCGFSMENDYARITLDESQILAEGEFLKKRGFRHLLILTGEAEKSSIAMIANAVKLLQPMFDSIGIEIQPLDQNDYGTMLEAGADSLTVYQETYHPDAYKKYHTRGKKSNFSYRLATPERGSKAGFYGINIGVLLGLYEWRYEALALAQHLHYLQKHFWQSHFSVSFPRIKNVIGGFQPEVPVSDLEFVQLICAFRLAFADAGITLSTRENPDLRNHLFKLGITTISAESKTNPGGYTVLKDESEGQFETSDHRSLEEILAHLKLNGFDPVLKNWAKELHLHEPTCA